MSKKTPRSPERDREGGGGSIEGLFLRWKNEMAEEMKKMVEETKRQGNKTRQEIDGIRGELREREERWKEEIGELLERIDKLENEMKGWNRVGKRREEEGKEGWEKRIRELERKVERKEREARKKILIIRRVEVKEGGRKKAMEEIFGRIEAKVDIEKVRRVEGNKKKGREKV